MHNVIKRTKTCFGGRFYPAMCWSTVCSPKNNKTSQNESAKKRKRNMPTHARVTPLRLPRASLHLLLTSVGHDSQPTKSCKRSQSTVLQNNQQPQPFESTPTCTQTEAFSSSPISKDRKQQEKQCTPLALRVRGTRPPHPSQSHCGTAAERL